MSQRLKRDANSGLLSLARPGISTRSQNIQISNDQNLDQIKKLTNNKRKADASPGKQKLPKQKRSALGNLTNATTLNYDDNRTKTKKTNTFVKESTTIVNKTNAANENSKQLPPPVVIPRATKIVTRAAAARSKISTNSIKESTTGSTKTTVLASKSKETLTYIPKPQTRRISNEFENNENEETLYMSALEDVSLNSDLKSKISPIFRNSKEIDVKSIETSETEEIKRIAKAEIIEYNVPDGVVDFDKENWDDTYQVSHYAMDIFNYLKEREKQFPIRDYMAGQQTITKWMRTLLIDWMVEVQETFELNHETLYLGVKLVDIYLGKEIVPKESLQLLGAAALFISSKFDERTPPLIDDFLFICDGAYKKKELIQMEMNVLKKIDFDLGIPLSYRFLRRYARCAKVTMPILTLARYILENSLMDYSTIMYSDSKMAAAALFMALRMNKLQGWTDTLKYYSGYELYEFSEIVTVLNAGLQRKPKEAVSTIRNKYSHTVFLEVALTPVRSTIDLLKNVD